MPDILTAFRDLKMDRVDDSYAAVIAARRHERAFDKFLAEPFLEAVAQGAAECYEANRVQIEALEPDQQRHQRGELRRRWLVAVIKYTPLQLDSFVRRAEFEWFCRPHAAPRHARRDRKTAARRLIGG